MKGVYLDHAAATPLDPRVLEAMKPYLSDSFGNASSVHALGRKARFAVEESREKIAALLGAEPGEIVFTSGGTESNNTALRGIDRTLVTCATEHESVLRTAERLDAEGRRVVIANPDRNGVLAPEAVEQILDSLGDEKALVSVMHANNEIGTVSPLEEIVETCRRRGAVVHCDAVQTVGYGLIRVDEFDVDVLTASAHKFYGPKGIGLLFVRGGTEFRPLVRGGAQERKRRGGTENVPAIVGFAEALRLAIESADERRERAAAMRDRLYRSIVDQLGHRVVVNTPLREYPTAPHILNLAFPPVDGEPVDGEMLLLNLDVEGIYASAGSACTSGALEPSHVLTAIGLPKETAAAAVRFSVGKETSREDVDRAAEALGRVVRRMSPARTQT